MKRTLTACVILLITACSRRDFHFSGKVVDPLSGRGISGAYVAIQGMYAESFMGGPIYYDDLVLDSTDGNGNFRATASGRRVDSFLKAHNGILSTFRFALTIRADRANETVIRNPPDGNLFYRLNDVDSTPNLPDQNYYDHHIIFVGKKNAIPDDQADMVVRFYRSARVRLNVGGDTAYARDNALYVQADAPPANGGTKPRMDFLYLDRQALQHPLILPSNQPLTLTFCKWSRATHTRDTLLVKTGLVLSPGGTEEISVPAAREVPRRAARDVPRQAVREVPRQAAQ